MEAASGTWTLYFLNGLITGLPTILLPQLRKANQTISMEEGSWLPALHTYSGIPWVLLLSALMATLGRKKSHLLVCVSTVLGFLCFYFSTNITYFLIAEVFLGATSATFFTINIAILTECVSPRYRGVFLTIKSASYFWGVLVANAMGTYLQWRSVVVLGLVCSVYSLLNALLWPESPLWLAAKRRYAECETSHRWLKGSSVLAEQELARMLHYHETNSSRRECSVRYVCGLLHRKRFYKPVLLGYLLACVNIFSGKLVCTVFAIDVLKKITSSEATAHNTMLVLDGVTVASMYVGCLLSKVLKRRVMLIGFSVISIAIMVIISVYLYLSKLAVIDENKYVSIILLAGYSITISCGPSILTTTVLGEMLPLQSRILSMIIIAIGSKITLGTVYKLSPLCFKYLAIHGTFAMFAVFSGIMLVIVYLYVPETKDKTLQEIEDSLLGREYNSNGENSKLMNVGVNMLGNNKEDIK